MKNEMPWKPLMLPRRFKMAGLIVCAAGIASIFFREQLAALPLPAETVEWIILKVIMSGLFFIAWSRDKIEDELTLAIRHRAALFAFFFIVAADGFIRPLGNLIKDGTAGAVSADSVIMKMLILYILTYHLTKRRYR